MPTPSEPEKWGDHPEFRTLRRLVTILTATLTIGVLTIAVALVIRILTESGPPPIASVGAETIVLPAGETIISVGATSAALAIATRDGAGDERLRLYHPDTGAPVDVVDLIRD